MCKLDIEEAGIIARWSVSDIFPSLFEWGDPGPCWLQKPYSPVMRIFADGRTGVWPHSEA